MDQADQTTCSDLLSITLNDVSVGKNSEGERKIADFTKDNDLRGLYGKYGFYPQGFGAAEENIP